MCIIMAKESGKHFNREELVSAIKVAKIHNSHGAGFAFKRGNSPFIYLSKGYLYYYDLMLEKIDELDVQPEDELMIHLRFATAGSVNAANCHPYIVSKELSEITKDEEETTLPVMAHNGSFYDYTFKDDVNSDTVNFVSMFAAHENAINTLSVLKNIDLKEGTSLLENVIQRNRLCFMFPGDKKMVRYGDWNRYTDEETYSLVYSNLYHKYPTPDKAYGDVSPHSYNKK